MLAFRESEPDCMDDPTARADRFELLAVCEASTLSDLANDVLATDPPVDVVQEPKPQLVMQRVREPVAERPFNLGEVVVTPAEVTLGDARGFAMYPGKAERAALSAAIVDAAVAGGHPERARLLERLRQAGERHERKREREWSESRHTTVEFESMEGDL